MISLFMSIIYYQGKYITQNIYILSLAATNNLAEAQFYLGVLYIKFNQGINFLIQSSRNENFNSHHRNSFE